ncbi:MAG: hypothetical protein FWD18_10390, partial [Micrococcales bacterium]|nr:hypothetical protein [Micrococcales bacterium]
KGWTVSEGAGFWPKVDQAYIELDKAKEAAAGMRREAEDLLRRDGWGDQERARSILEFLAHAEGVVARAERALTQAADHVICGSGSDEKPDRPTTVRD